MRARIQKERFEQFKQVHENIIPVFRICLTHLLKFTSRNIVGKPATHQKRSVIRLDLFLNNLFAHLTKASSEFCERGQTKVLFQKILQITVEFKFLKKIWIFKHGLCLKLCKIIIHTPQKIGVGNSRYLCLDFLS